MIKGVPVTLEGSVQSCPCHPIIPLSQISSVPSLGSGLRCMAPDHCRFVGDRERLKDLKALENHPKGLQELQQDLYRN